LVIPSDLAVVNIFVGHVHKLYQIKTRVEWIERIFVARTLPLAHLHRGISRFGSSGNDGTSSPSSCITLPYTLDFVLSFVQLFNCIVSPHRSLSIMLNTRRRLQQPDVTVADRDYSFFTAQRHASAVYTVVTCLSVTSRCSTETAKRRIMQRTPHDSPVTDVEDLGKTQTG